MINRIKSFFAFVRLSVFTTLVEREIYHRIAPHIHKEKDCGYSFACEQELLDAALQGNHDLKSQIAMIERAAENMGKAYGEAFRYIMYRDLSNRLLPYLKLAQWRIAPRFRVAKYAQ